MLPSFWDPFEWCSACSVYHCWIQLTFHTIWRTKSPSNSIAGEETSVLWRQIPESGNNTLGKTVTILGWAIHYCKVQSIIVHPARRDKKATPEQGTGIRTESLQVHTSAQAFLSTSLDVDIKTCYLLGSPPTSFPWFLCSFLSGGSPIWSRAPRVWFLWDEMWQALWQALWWAAVAPVPWAEADRCLRGTELRSDNRASVCTPQIFLKLASSFSFWPKAWPTSLLRNELSGENILRAGKQLLKHHFILMPICFQSVSVSVWVCLTWNCTIPRVISRTNCTRSMEREREIPRRYSGNIINSYGVSGCLSMHESTKKAHVHIHPHSTPGCCRIP